MESFSTKREKRKNKEQDAARPTHQHWRQWFKLSRPTDINWRWVYSGTFHQSKREDRCSNQNTHTFKSRLKKKKKWKGEENHHKTLELRIQSHHHYNFFEDKPSTCLYRPEREAAFCSQLHRYYLQPEARWSIPAPFLSYILLGTARQHRNETPATAGMPECTWSSHCYSHLSNSPTCADSFLYFPSPAYTSIPCHLHSQDTYSLCPVITS